MPSALLKQSKDFRFFTLRRRGRPFPEIAPAAGWADACEYCSPSGLRGPQPRPSGGPQRHSHRCVLRRLPPETQSAFPPPSANSKPNTPTITSLRCQSSLTFGGLTSYLFHKTGVTPASTSRPYYKKNRPRESRSRPDLPLSHYSAFTCKASELLRLAALFL